MTLYGKICDQVKGLERRCFSWIIWVGPKCNHMYPFIREAGVKVFRETRRGDRCEDQPPEAEKKQRTDSSLELPQRILPCRPINLDFRLLTSRTVRIHFCCSKHTQFVAICHGNHRKLIQESGSAPA